MAEVTQEEIAKRLNLSRTTVSRCFTHHPKINPETRAQVFRLAAELGYCYSAPRNVRERADGKEVRRIAVLVGMPRWQIVAVDTASQIMAGISERAAAAGLEMEVHYIDPQSFLPVSRTRRVVKGINLSDWAGVLLLYPFAEKAVKNLMSRIPLLSILDEYNELGIDCVEPDQHHGLVDIVDHLHKLGHRRIGFLSWKYRVPAAWVERRLGTYLEQLFLHRLPIEPNNILNIHDDEQIPLEVLVDEVARRVRAGVTAWMCAADHQAYHLVAGLTKLGIRVPQDCSVTGFDGVPPPDGLPQLTTVAVSLRDVGISAVHELERKMNEPSPRRRHVLVAGRLITGETTAKPPSTLQVSSAS